jgi:hypothetical protein
MHVTLRIVIVLGLASFLYSFVGTTHAYHGWGDGRNVLDRIPQNTHEWFDRIALSPIHDFGVIRYLGAATFIVGAIGLIADKRRGIKNVAA